MQLRSIIFYAVTICFILVLTVLSPRYGSKHILIDLGLTALYGMSDP